MTFRFTVLASGSGGNASVLECGDFSLLIDLGLGPRQLATRLGAVGLSWQRIQAAFLTHTHADHWKENTLAQLLEQEVPLYCHPEHGGYLLHSSPAFGALRARGLVRRYEPGQDLEVTARLRCRPTEVCHDALATCGFRFETVADHGPRSSVGYLADLGCWKPDLADFFADCDLLALEFNHDVTLERSSRRPWHLVARVLGDYGHLSNLQAADLLAEILRRSQPGRLQHLVQLHLSSDCNRPDLALAAARTVLKQEQASPQVHVASQDEPTPSLWLDPSQTSGPLRHAVDIGNEPAFPRMRQAWLPGWEA